MRALPLILLAACSNAANPAADALVHHDGAPATDGAAPADAAPALVDAAPLRLLVINEVVAAGSPDWFEVVNATTDPIALADFIYVDAEGAFDKAVAFPAMTLAAGAYYAQDVDDATSGFKLGSAESLWVYRGADHALSDDVAWTDGQSPANGSYARIPDVFGPFVTSTTPTKGAPNHD